MRNAAATASGDCLSIATALFIACIALSVSFAETALTVCSEFAPPAVASFCETTGATFWKPKMCFVSVSTVYF